MDASKKYAAMCSTCGQKYYDGDLFCCQCAAPRRVLPDANACFIASPNMSHISSKTIVTPAAPTMPPHNASEVIADLRSSFTPSRNMPVGASSDSAFNPIAHIGSSSRNRRRSSTPQAYKEFTPNMKMKKFAGSCKTMAVTILKENNCNNRTVQELEFATGWFQWETSDTRDVLIGRIISFLENHNVTYTEPTHDWNFGRVNGRCVMKSFSTMEHVDGQVLWDTHKGKRTIYIQLNHDPNPPMSEDKTGGEDENSFDDLELDPVYQHNLLSRYTTPCSFGNKFGSGQKPHDMQSSCDNDVYNGDDIPIASSLEVSTQGHISSHRVLAMRNNEHREQVHQQTDDKAAEGKDLTIVNLCIPDSLCLNGDSQNTQAEIGTMDTLNQAVVVTSCPDDANSNTAMPYTDNPLTALETSHVACHDILKEVQKRVLKDSPRDTIIVEHDQELDCIIQQLLSSDKKKLLTDFRVEYIGDHAIDLGGVKKQFLAKCVETALQLHFVQIDSGGFRFKTNTSKEMSYKVGQILSLSLIHGGPSMHLADYVLDFILDKENMLCQNKLQNSEPNNYLNYSDPGDEILANLFEKLQPLVHDRNERGLADFLVSNEGRLYMSQYWSDISDGELSINNFEKFKETVLWRHLIESKFLQLDSFVLGLDYFDIASTLRNYGGASKQLFGRPVLASCWFINKLIEPSVSKGSQKDKCYDMFLAYLVSMEGKTVSEVIGEQVPQDGPMMIQIHQFITSLPYSPSGATDIHVGFIEGKYARSSTCTNTISLPLEHQTEEDFISYMNKSIIGSGTLIDD